MTTQAVGYLRVSGKRQVKGDGFSRQREAILAYAKSAKYNIVDEFCDEGVSGTKELEGRAELAALLDLCRSGEIKVVLVERADRLARDLMVGEVILGQFRDLNVRVIAVDSGTDLTAHNDDPTRTLIRQVLGAVAQFEKSVMVSKLRAARERARIRHGSCEGRKPFGKNPEEKKTLIRMKQLRRIVNETCRLSYAKIADILNDEGHQTRHGRPWVSGTIRKILKR